MIRTPFQSFEFAGESHHFTDEGGLLRIKESCDTVAQIEMGVHHKDTTDEMLPSDVLYSRFRVPDKDGVVWECESRFGTARLVEKMCDLSIPSMLIPFSDADADALSALNGKDVLREARYSSDDRFYRSIVVGDQIIRLQFRYTVISFDLAFSAADASFTRLYVKIREDSLILDGDDLGAFYFEMDPFVGSNTAFYSAMEERWGDNVIPAPAPFRRTSEKHDPNENVEYA